MHCHSCVPIFGNRSVVYPLHIRHYGKPKGVGTWQRWSSAVAMKYRWASTTCRKMAYLGGFWCRLGCGAFLHCLRATDSRLHDHFVWRCWYERQTPVHSGVCVKSTKSMCCFPRQQHLEQSRKKIPKASCLLSMTYHHSSRFSRWRALRPAKHWIGLNLILISWLSIIRWQTETGWAISANPTGWNLPVKAGFQRASYRVTTSGDPQWTRWRKPSLINKGLWLLNAHYHQVALHRSVWRTGDRFESGYLSQFPGYYVSGDGGYLWWRRLSIYHGSYWWCD